MKKQDIDEVWANLHTCNNQQEEAPNMKKADERRKQERRGIMALLTKNRVLPTYQNPLETFHIKLQRHYGITWRIEGEGEGENGNCIWYLWYDMASSYLAGGRAGRSDR